MVRSFGITSASTTSSNSYNKDEQTSEKQLEIEILVEKGKYSVKYYLLDEKHDNKLVKEEELDGEELKIKLNMPLFTCYYVELLKINQ